mgnify:FL=1
MLCLRKGRNDPEDLEGGGLPVLGRRLYDGGDGGVVFHTGLRPVSAVLLSLPSPSSTPSARCGFSCPGLPCLCSPSPSLPRPPVLFSPFPLASHDGLRAVTGSRPLPLFPFSSSLSLPFVARQVFGRAGRQVGSTEGSNGSVSTFPRLFCTPEVNFYAHVVAGL